MKYIIAFVCIAGIAVASAAPYAESFLQTRASKESRFRRSAEVAEVANPAVIDRQERDALEPASENQNQNQERAADSPLPEAAAVEEKAAEIPQEPAVADRSAVPLSQDGAVIPEPAVADRFALPESQDRGVMLGYKDVVNAVQDKYLTRDGQALLKSLLPFA